MYTIVSTTKLYVRARKCNNNHNIVLYMNVIMFNINKSLHMKVHRGQRKGKK